MPNWNRTSTLTQVGTLLVALALGGCGDKTKPAPTPAATETAPTVATAKPATKVPPADPSKVPVKKPADSVAAEPGTPVEVVLWHSYRADEKTAFDQVVAMFNASHKDVQIRAQAIPYDPFVDKITITVPRGQGPDLFIFAHNMVGNWVEKGVLEPLSGKVPNAVLKQHIPNAVPALVYRKNLYGLPLAFKSLVLFYNKDLLPEVPATMEELVAKVKPLQAQKKERFGLVYQAGGLYFHAPFMHAFGGAIFDVDHNPTLDTEGQLKAIEYVRNLYANEKVLPKGVSGFMLTSLFNDGDAVAVLNGPWFRPEIKPGLNYGVATIPTVAGHTPKPFLGIESVFVTKTSKHKEAALEAALYLAGAESAAVRMRVGKQPVTHAATLAKGAKEDPAMKVFLEQSQNAVLMDATPEMQMVWSTMDIAISAGVFVADRDPKTELTKAQAKLLGDLEKRDK